MQNFLPVFLFLSFQKINQLNFIQIQSVHPPNDSKEKSTHQIQIIYKIIH